MRPFDRATCYRCPLIVATSPSPCDLLLLRLGPNLRGMFSSRIILTPPPLPFRAPAHATLPARRPCLTWVGIDDLCDAHPTSQAYKKKATEIRVPCTCGL